VSKTFKDKEKNFKDKIKNPKLGYSRKRKYRKEIFEDIDDKEISKDLIEDVGDGK